MQITSSGVHGPSMLAHFLEFCSRLPAALNQGPWPEVWPVQAVRHKGQPNYKPGPKYPLRTPNPSGTYVAGTEVPILGQEGRRGPLPDLIQTQPGPCLDAA